MTQEEFLNFFPRGMIVGWFSQHIPHGWALCDGSHGRPNLVDRFPYGTDSAQQLGVAPPNSSAEHSHNFSGSTAGVVWGDRVGGPAREQGTIDITGGDNLTTHMHPFQGNTSVSNWLPPATKIMFIIKL